MSFQPFFSWCPFSCRPVISGGWGFGFIIFNKGRKYSNFFIINQIKIIIMMIKIIREIEMIKIIREIEKDKTAESREIEFSFGFRDFMKFIAFIEG